MNHFLNSVLLRDYAPLAQRLCVRTKDIRPMRMTHAGTKMHPAEYADTLVGRVRDHFTSAEIQALLQLPLTKRDALVLRIMAETGLRRRAVSWLLVDGVYDRCNRSALPVARALEKGLVMRPFVLSTPTTVLMHDYMENEHPGPQYRWLFPSPKKGYLYPVNPSVINKILLRACRMANIRGVLTHAGQQPDRGSCYCQTQKHALDVAKWLAPGMHFIPCVCVRP